MQLPGTPEPKAVLDLHATHWAASDKPCICFFPSHSLSFFFFIASEKMSASFVEAIIIVAGHIVICVDNCSADFQKTPATR